MAAFLHLLTEKASEGSINDDDMSNINRSYMSNWEMHAAQLTVGIAVAIVATMAALAPAMAPS